MDSSCNPAMCQVKTTETPDGDPLSHAPQLRCHFNPRGESTLYLFFFFNDTRTPEIYPLPLHAALPISASPTGPPQHCLGLRPRLFRPRIRSRAGITPMEPSWSHSSCSFGR